MLFGKSYLKSKKPYNSLFNKSKEVVTPLPPHPPTRPFYFLERRCDFLPLFSLWKSKWSYTYIVIQAHETQIIRKTMRQKNESPGTKL